MAIIETIAEQDWNIQERLQCYIDEGKTYEMISDILKDEYSVIRGLSARSVRRFCASKAISKKGARLDAAVAQTVSEVC